MSNGKCDCPEKDTESEYADRVSGLLCENIKLKEELAATNHDIKELTRCVADYKAENNRQKKIINAFLAYRNFIKSLTPSKA